MCQKYEQFYENPQNATIAVAKFWTMFCVECMVCSCGTPYKVEIETSLATVFYSASLW